MKDKIIDLRKKGYTINEIVKELKCSKSTVSYHINKIGLGGVRDKFISDIDNDVIGHIKQMRNNGESYEDILNVINITKDKLIKVCRILEKNTSTGKFKKIELNNEKVTKYYIEVKSIRKTAKHFNVDRKTVRRFIDEKEILNKKEKKVSKTEAVINFRRRIKNKLVEYKGGSCVKCGYNKSIQVLQFHHINPNEKDFTISGKSYSFEKMKNEVDKCILLCSNCHIELHEELRLNK